MKYSIISVATLSAIAAAQPHHYRRHQHHAKREWATDTVTATATELAATLYVDEYGVPIATSYADGYESPPTGQPYPEWPHPTGWGSPPAPSSDSGGEPSAAPVDYSTSAPATPESTEAPVQSDSPQPDTSTAPPAYSEPKSSSSPPPPSSSGPSGSGSGSVGSGFGLSYAPYNGDHSCKTQDQVNADFDAFLQNQDQQYNFVRIYGTDCDQVNIVLNAATQRNLQVFAGVWDIDAVEDEINLIVDAAKGNWQSIPTISIGNELVAGGTAPEKVTGAIDSARTLLGVAGYPGSIVTVDVVQSFKDHPELCQKSDFAAANAHAFFDSTATPDRAGDIVAGQASDVATACGGKKVVITESGWPWKGDQNGDAIPSVDNQIAAIKSLRAKYRDNPGDIVLFSAFSDAWKEDRDGTYGTEKYWGIYPSPDA